MVKQLLVYQHGTGDFEKAICNAAQSSCVPVSTSAKNGVFGFADRVMLDRYLSPVVDGLLQPGIHCVTPHHQIKFGGTLGDRRRTAQRPQCVIIPQQQNI